MEDITSQGLGRHAQNPFKPKSEHNSIPAAAMKSLPVGSCGEMGDGDTALPKSVAPGNHAPSKDHAPKNT